MAAINTLLELFEGQIKSDAGISTWSNTNYSRDLFVSENCDSRDLPKETDCPLVIIFPVSKEAGLSQSNKNHKIGISCVVYDDDKPESAAGVVRFKGGRLVEELRQKVLKVITDNMPSGCHLESIKIEYDTIEQFPYVSANMQIEITEEKLIGQDPYE
ncbi:MAG: hypothetical protein KAJ62_12425 [Desulfobacteraceae bacterium]|nr:hypothetical protein [Desulfobacteraceae bacterium]